MAKIAAAIDHALARRRETGGGGHPEARTLARGDGWAVADVVCASGPHDRPFEEQHASVSIAIVAAGTFQYRSALGRELMTPGSLLLGSAGQRFECSHDHGAGDRCIAFWFEREYFERVARDAGARGHRSDFSALRLPPLRALSPLVARACAGVTAPVDVPWDELGIELAARTVRLLADASSGSRGAPSHATARVARLVRAIDGHLSAAQDVGRLARATGLSPYHFLRTFTRVTGVTPHQFVLRARLREAARRLATGRDRVVDVALDCGFNDVSNFNRTFRAEFGATPRQFRAARCRR